MELQFRRTADGAGLLIGAIAAAITAGAHDGRGAAESVAAAMRAIGIRLSATGQQATRFDQAHEEIGHGTRAAEMGRLIAAILAGDNGIAVLVLGQAFAALAAERVRRTAVAALQMAIAAQLILAMRTLFASVAERRTRDATAAALATERLRRTGLIEAGIVGALLIRIIVTVGASIAHEEPRDANAARTALEESERNSISYGKLH